MAPQYNIGTGYTHAYLPVIIEKDIGEWSAIGNLGFGYNPGQGNRNYGFAGMVLTREIIGPLKLGGELYYQSPDQTGRKDLIAFNIGGQYKPAGNQSVYFAAGRGLLNGRNANEFNGYFGYQINF